MPTKTVLLQSRIEIMSTHNYKTLEKFKIHQALYQFIADEVCPGLEIKTDDFFTLLVQILGELEGENQALLNKRNHLQAQIDQWHKDNPVHNPQKYKQFLQEIGYLLPKPAPFSIELDNVDKEISQIAGPQLVVPVSSARFALNAVNARWGSLYDALYGTNAIDYEQYPATKGNNAARINQVINWANTFLDEVVPLALGSYAQIVTVSVTQQALIFTLDNGTTTQLKDSVAFIGMSDQQNALIEHNRLHIELVIDKNTQGIKDILLESAVTTIIDFEDSVATVGSEEKINAYRHFLGLMKRDLQVSFDKGGVEVTRSMNDDKQYLDTSGAHKSLPASSLMLVRNVGHHMFTDLIKNADGDEIPEGILDAMVTVLIALHDIKHLRKNSKQGNIYIVKPKMHGAEEVAFSVKLFAKVESALGLKPNTLKIGIMDEERRTSVNLLACIEAAKKRVIFINTGFLDRTGDEIHTSMYAGAMLPKDQIKQQSWIAAYEALNVKTGLSCGMYENAQIGKGMWAQPDQMHEMLETKIAHLQAGANCAWVPSPTAATLHATHYHQFDVFDKQKQLMKDGDAVDEDALLTIPLMKDKLSTAAIQAELDNNAQSILGYVVRWIDQGIGCSKVKDINHVGLMEDRATLRITSQHIANWLHHQICSEEQVEQSLKAMAIVVDEQNKDDPLYVNMAPNYDGFAFQAALALIHRGKEEANGYTEAVLREYRQKKLKALFT